MERAYTIREIDALRQAARTRWLFGTTLQRTEPTMSRSYMQADMDRAVEEQVRTYMLAGITADDIYAQDRGITVEQLNGLRNVSVEAPK